jgi:hypothetical protein
MKLPDLDHDEFIPLPGDPPPPALDQGRSVSSGEAYRRVTETVERRRRRT